MLTVEKLEDLVAERECDDKLFEAQGEAFEVIDLRKSFRPHLHVAAFQSTFITLCSGEALYLRHPIWNFGGRIPGTRSCVDDQPRLKCLITMHFSRMHGLAKTRPVPARIKVETIAFVQSK